MKITYLKTLTLVAIMLAISSGRAGAVDIICDNPAGVTIPTVANSANAVFNPNHYNQVFEYLIPQSEITAAGGMAGLVNSLAVRLNNNNSDGTSKTVGSAPNTFTMYLANVPWTNMQGSWPDGTFSTAATHTDEVMSEFGGWTQVYFKENFDWDKLHEEHLGDLRHYDTTLSEDEKWPTFIFNQGTPFEYTGRGLAVKICITRTASTGSANTNFKCVGGGSIVTDSWLYGRSATNQTNLCDIANIGTTSNPGDNRPIIKLDMTLVPPPTNYSYSEVMQAVGIADVKPGTPNVPVLQLRISVYGNEPLTQIDNIVFSGKNSGGIISAAKLYYSGSGSQTPNSFNTQDLQELAVIDFSEDIGANTDTFSFDFDAIELPAGVNNFWLVYDIYGGSPVGDGIVDAKFESMQLSENNIEIEIDPPTDYPDPPGAINILVAGYRYAGTVNAEGIPTNSTPLGGSAMTSRSPLGFYSNAEYAIVTYPPEAFGATAGEISKLSLYVHRQLNVITGRYDMQDSVYILMKNNPNPTTGVAAWPTNLKTLFSGTTVATGSWNDLNMFSAEEFITLAQADGFELVKGPFNWNIRQWPNTTNPPASPFNCDIPFWTEELQLNEPFNYEGAGVDIIFFKSNWSRSPGVTGGLSADAWTNRVYKLGGYTGTTNHLRYGYANPTPTTDPLQMPLGSGNTFEKQPTAGNHTSTFTNVASRPYLRSYVSYYPGHFHKPGYCFQPNTTQVAEGARDAAVMGVCVEITGQDESPYLYAKSFAFDGKNSSSAGQIVAARLYYTGSDSTFSVLQQVGETFNNITSSNVNNITFSIGDIADNGLKLGTGKHYFWLSFETAEGSAGQQIDAAFKNAILNKVYIDGDVMEGLPLDITASTSNKDPEGYEKTIVAPLTGGIYYVGEDYTTYGGAGGADNLYNLAELFSTQGVTGDVDIRIVSNISDTRTAVFGASQYNNIHYTLSSEGDETYTLTNTNTDAESAVIWLAGVNNFHISKLNLTKTEGGCALKINSTDGTIVENCTLTGVTDVLSIINSQNFDVKNNTLLRATAFGINITNNSTSGKISNNKLSGTGGNALANGINITDNSANIIVTNNIINALTGILKSTAIKIKGNSARQDLALSISNNTIYDVNATDTASVFEINNASNVKIYHNTAMLLATNDQKSTQVFYLSDNTTSLTILNNVFVNNTASPANLAVKSQIFLTPSNISLYGASDLADNNVYSGNAVFGRYDNNAEITLSSWKTATSKETNSVKDLVVGSYTNDGHLDGEILDLKAMLVPILNNTTYPNANIDMDGPRGADKDKYVNMTTAGADETLMTIKLIDNYSTLPRNLMQCAGATSPISLRVEKEWDSWFDGIVRTYKPKSLNYWITTDGDTLTMTNGGFETAYYPYMSIEVPNYNHTKTFSCHTQVGYYHSETELCSLAIIVPPFIRNIENINICIDAGVLDIEAVIEGTARTMQWQKKSGNNWANLQTAGTGYNTSHYSISFENTPAGIASIEGTYRLAVVPYSDCGDKTLAYYSNEITVNTGSPISAVNIAASHTESEFETGICTNDSTIWLAAGLAAGTDGTIIRYQWAKVDPETGALIDIPVADNKTADKDTFKIAYATLNDAGAYACKIYGIEGCGSTPELITNTININIGLTAQIIGQPTDVYACHGQTLTQELAAIITQPTTGMPGNIQYNNKYQWFKFDKNNQGTPVVRFNEIGDTLTSADGTLYTELRTDTTWLQFGSLQFEDGGKYALRMIYLDCKGQEDTIFTKTVNLYVFDKTRIVSQTSTVYGVIGGFTTLYVEAVTSASGGQAGAPGVSYQWYRRHGSQGTIKLADNAKYYGSQSPVLTIMDINSDDITTAYGDYYYCEIQDLCGSGSIVSDHILIEQAPDFQITAQPASLVVCEDATDNVSLSIGATANNAALKLYYTWYKEGENTPIYQGEGMNTLALTDITTMQAQYYCVVSIVGLAGSNKQSDFANVTVEPKPVISQFVYASTMVKEGDELKIEVIITNPDIDYTYEWYRDNTLIPMADSSVYYIAKATKDDEGTYYVKVLSKHNCGEATSESIAIGIVGIIENDNPYFRIESVVPNPVTNEAIVSFILPEAGFATLTLIDIQGKPLFEVYAGEATEGKNVVDITDKLKNLSTGAYLLLLQSSASHGATVAIKLTINKG